MFHALALATLLGSQVTTSNICSTQACVVYAETPTDLYQIDPVSLSFTHLCTFTGVDGYVNDIAVDNNGNLYGLTDDALYMVDTTSCYSSEITSVAQVSASFNGLTFLINGDLIAADGYGNVVQIDTGTGAVNQVGYFGGSYGCSGDIVALSNGVIYATAIGGSGNGDTLVTLDPNTYAATPVGVVHGYPGIYGLGFWAGVLYGFDQAGNVLSIDPSSGSAQVIASNASLVWFGAGTTPQAPVVCNNPCTPGTTQCDGNGDLDVCTTQSNGCAGWSGSPCGGGLICNGGQCVSTCSNQCSSGATQCDSNGDLDTCTLQGDGCLDWSAASCGSGLTCSGGQCVATCSNQCIPFTTQCDSSGNLDTCSLEGNGCFDWLTSSCGNGLVCNGGQCVSACANRCANGSTQCDPSGNGNVDNCQVSGNGCTNWVSSACPSGQTCSNGSCVPACASRCLPGTTQCDANGDLDSCTLQGNGCFDWSPAACASGDVCTGGACVSACVSRCASGQVGCDGNTPETCEAQSDGCYGWVDGAPCPTGQVCSNGQCATNCANPCSAGQVQCSGSLPQTCDTESNGCTGWDNGTDCGPPGCIDGACCTCVAGATQCASASSVETCAGGSSTMCPSWVTTACPNSGTCLDGTCLVTCNPQSELNTCSAGERCLNVAGGSYCVTPTADGGFIPGTSSSTGGTGQGQGMGAGITGSGIGASGNTGAGSNGTSSPNTGASSGASGTTGVGVTHGATVGGPSGTSGSTGHSVSGSTTGGVGGIGGIGAAAGSSGKSGSSGSTQGSSGKNGSVTTTGCSCTSAPSAADLGWMLLAALGLRRRRS